MNLDLLWYGVQALYGVTLSLLALTGLYFLVIAIARWGIRREPRPTPGLKHPRPRVTVQVPLRNEFYVTSRVLDAVGALEWPRERLQIQVIDDSDDETTTLATQGLRKIQESGIQAALIRRPDPSGSKAGALNDALG